MSKEANEMWEEVDTHRRENLPPFPKGGILKSAHMKLQNPSSRINKKIGSYRKLGEMLL